MLGEAVQTVMRRYGIEKPYEKLKKLTRDRDIDQHSLRAFIATLAIPEAEKARLLTMEPATYIGNAVAQARDL